MNVSVNGDPAESSSAGITSFMPPMTTNNAAGSAWTNPQ
jgi:hypothetical protein